MNTWEGHGDHELYYWEQMMDPAFSFLAGIEEGTKDKLVIHWLRGYVQRPDPAGFGAGSGLVFVDMDLKKKEREKQCSTGQNSWISIRG